ncbi:MAG: ABC transporter ATP-binding protein [Candidatus Kariarchaeaceae archaeon]
MVHVKLDRVTKIYHDDGDNSNFQALSGIDLEVDHGEFIIIVGPSGAGKSTLLNILGGNISPSSGRITVNNYQLHTMSLPDLQDYRRRHCGFLWQESEQNLISDLSVDQNLKQVMRIGNYKGNRKERIDHILREIQMEHRKHHPIRKLSGGEALRISLAMAVINDPELLILDEPVAELDNKTAHDVIQYLLKLNKEGKTIIVSTHNRLFNSVADRTYQLLDGMIVTMVPRGYTEKTHILKMNRLGQLQIPQTIREDKDLKYLKISELEDGLKLEPYDDETK